MLQMLANGISGEKDRSQGSQGAIAILPAKSNKDVGQNIVTGYREIDRFEKNAGTESTKTEQRSRFQKMETAVCEGF